MRFVARARGLAAVGMALAGIAGAATYRPMSDGDLVASAPVVVRARVGSVSVRSDVIAGVPAPFTVVSLERIEVFRGSIPDVFTIRLPGGRDGERVWWVPGVPHFARGDEVVLMLAESGRDDGAYRLTELGLSKFEVFADATGRRFVRRAVFTSSEELAVSKRGPASDGPIARDAESFFAFLRAAGRGEPPVPVSWSKPAPESRSKWVNIGGQEPGECSDGSPCLSRWFWDTGNSPLAVVTVNGTQSNLSGDTGGCGKDSLCGVQKAVDSWHGVAQSDVRYGGLAPSGNVEVDLDASESFDGGIAWNTPVGCDGGVIGIGGPTSSGPPQAYRGDPNYFFTTGGRVSMRKDTCGIGYAAEEFRSAVLHELGHTLGLGHPDQDVSLHSMSDFQDVDAAVMHSVMPPSRPKVPQSDDIQAIQYYYGTAPVGPLPHAEFDVTVPYPDQPNDVYVQVRTPDATACKWDFGDPGSRDNVIMGCSSQHLFGAAGRYTITLIAANANGSSISSSVVEVSTPSCVAAPDVLCLDGGRFRVSMTWQRPDGSSGSGTAVGLTSDSGYFWFFDPANIEVTLKVLNGCALGGHYWVFAAGLTNLYTTLTVVDLNHTTTYSSINPQGTPFAPIQDTSAFATCP